MITLIVAVPWRQTEKELAHNHFKYGQVLDVLGPTRDRRHFMQVLKEQDYKLENISFLGGSDKAVYACVYAIGCEYYHTGQFWNIFKIVQYQNFQSNPVEIWRNRDGEPTLFDPNPPIM